MTRRNFSKATMAQRFLVCGGRCEECGVALVPGRWECDHANPDALTGEPTLANARCLCRGCHSEKTKVDSGRIAKAKRVEAKAIGVPETKRPIRSRGFRKKEKPERMPVPPPRGLYA